MVNYKFDCFKCTNFAVNAQGNTYCLPMIKGKRACYLEEGHTGTKDDPDVMLCDYYTTEARQLALYETEAKEAQEDG